MKNLFQFCYSSKNLFRHKTLVSILFSFFTFLSFSQVKDSTAVNQLDDVLVAAIRVTSKTPVSFSNLSKEEIGKRNLGQDIPLLLNFLPSVVTTSDAGNGFGYTGIRVRGSDARSVNVTLNGIPYNDSESQGTYFVNLPDFASSLQSVQLQRGVGTSTNGASAFGASLNMLTDNFSKISSAEIANTFGSFNSRKHTVKFSTGLLNDHFEISGRLSNIHSDGYVERAASDLRSYFLQGTYVGKTTLIKALVFGGTEKTYQAWYGIDAATLATNRRFNAAGMYTDAAGKTQFYDNQTDNYQQDHYQLHWNEKLNAFWNTNLAFHYTKGKGYYEEYQENQAFSDYGLTPIIIGSATISNTNLIRRKWLDNDFYGTTFSANYKKDKVDFIFGGSVNNYNGKHFGQIIWAQYASQSQNSEHYYDDFGNKFEFNVYSKINYQLTQKLSFYGDLQYRLVRYKANGIQTNLVKDEFNFFNPKAGLTYSVNKKQDLFFSYAKANREPNRTDYENGNPKPEQLNDFELGWRFKTAKTQLNLNGFYMVYKDQLVLTGALDNVGSPIRKNVGSSYRLGLEFDGVFILNEKWNLKPNFTISENKNKDFVNENGIILTPLGNTTIAFSPSVVAGNILSFQPKKNIELALYTKFVGQQYLSNTNDQNAKLPNYTTTDLNFNYELKTKSIFKSIVFSGMLNNVFDKQYVSNGADYGGGYVYYFAQAGINFLAGVNLKF
jgi:iron complex outermembrane receptor protein